MNFPEISSPITLNDLEPLKYEVLVIFAITGCNAHFKSA